MSTEVKTNNLKDVTPEGANEGIARDSEWYPSIRLKLEDIPEANNWEIGSDHILVIGARMQSLHKSEHGNDICLDVRKFKVIKDKKK